MMIKHELPGSTAEAVELAFTVATAITKHSDPKKITELMAKLHKVLAGSEYGVGVFAMILYFPGSSRAIFLKTSASQ